MYPERPKQTHCKNKVRGPVYSKWSQFENLDLLVDLEAFL